MLKHEMTTMEEEEFEVYISEQHPMFLETRKYLYRGVGVIVKEVGKVTGIVKTSKRLLHMNRIQLKPTSKYMPHQGTAECLRRL